MPSDIEDDDDDGIQTPSDPPPHGEVGDQVKTALTTLFEKYHVAPTRGRSVPVDAPEDSSDSDDEGESSRIFKRTAVSCDVKDMKEEGLFAIGNKAGDSPKTMMSARSHENLASTASAETHSVTEESARSPVSDAGGSDGKPEAERALVPPEFPSVAGQVAQDAEVKSHEEGQGQKAEGTSPAQVDFLLPLPTKVDGKGSEARRMSDGISPVEKFESPSETVEGRLPDRAQRVRMVLGAEAPQAERGGGSGTTAVAAEGQAQVSPRGLYPSPPGQSVREERKVERLGSSGQLKGVLKRAANDVEEGNMQTAGSSESASMRSFLVGLTAGLLFALALAALIVAVVAFRKL